MNAAERFFVLIIVGAIAGASIGCSISLLYAPARDPKYPLSGEWWIFMILRCMVFGGIGGAILGLVVALIRGKLVIPIGGMIIGIAMGSLFAWISAPDSLFAAESRPGRGLLHTFGGAVAGLLGGVVMRAMLAGKKPASISSTEKHNLS